MADEAAVVLETRFVTCPYCWAGFETSLDVSGGSQEYYEDCPVCCNPIRFRLRVGLSDSADLELEALRDDQ
jgi:hypothetical protein